ncbi:hypothetical protein UPYG_G00285870 [Umbra pygmaea]|uniref:Myb-like domain-containing protein n=1 Tax=Umbra pygmaea TaxID=75934 RepID=A0ABD0W4Y3_UMBPY
MLRRSRISVRPNVRPASRGPALASSQEPVPTSQEFPAADSQVSEDPPQAADQELKDTLKTGVTEIISTQSSRPEDGKDQNGEASSSTSSAGLQRRKRFSVMPNLAKPRAAPTPALARSSPRIHKSPFRGGTEHPAPTSYAPDPPSQPDAGPSQGMRSPRRRLSGDTRPAKEQHKPSALSPGPETSTTRLRKHAVNESSQSQPVPHAANKEATSTQVTKQEQCIIQSGVLKMAKAPSVPSEKVPSSSLPDKESISISERANTLATRSVSGGLAGLDPGKSRLSRLLNDPADLQRLAKARKLRELLRQEMNKEKKRSKAQVCLREYTVDPSKMTMRDLIYFLPETNPMTCSLEEDRRDEETILPLTPPREQSPDRPPTPGVTAETASQRDENEEEDDDANSGAMVPRVKVAEDGSLIIDEESLTVEVMRQKGPNPANDRDPIFERGSTTTYSSFRKGNHVKPWSIKETDMFFLAISMVGTDFSMIGQLFPHRGRTEIKNKFKKEERANSWRIDKAFKEKRRLDLKFFTTLLEKILEPKRKKKSATEKKETKKKIQKKEKKVAKLLSDVEEEDGEVSDIEVDRDGVEEGKKNEDTPNERTTHAPTNSKGKRKRTASGQESSPEKATGGKKKKKNNIITNDEEETGLPQEEAGILEESQEVLAEGDIPDDQSPAHSSKQAEEPGEGAKGPVVIKPAQLSRGRTQRPLPNLCRKWGKRGPEPKTTPKDKNGAIPAEEAITEIEFSKEQVAEDASLSNNEKKASDLSSSEEANDEPVKPTRSGRIPKKTQLLNYPGEKGRNSTSGSATVAVLDKSPATSTPKPKANPPTRRARIKPGPTLPGRKGQSAAVKSKLVTLRASQSEDDEDDEGDEDGGRRDRMQNEEELHNPTNFEEQNQAVAFVPMSLRPQSPVAVDVEETVAELDISVNVPDVLGISHNAFCTDLSCEREHGGEVGTIPCEHQLDLLVDVIDFLSPDNTNVSEDSYNEAARTLLAIGNLSYLSQAAETQECSNEDQPYQMIHQPTNQSQNSIPASGTQSPETLVIEASQISDNSVPVATSTTESCADTTTTLSVPVARIPSQTAENCDAVATTTSPVAVTTTTIAFQASRETALVPVTTTTNTVSVPVTITTSTATVTITSSAVNLKATAQCNLSTSAIIPVTTSKTCVPVSQSHDTFSREIPSIEAEPLRHTEEAVIGHASTVGSSSEEAERSEKLSTSKTRRSRFPKVKPNLGRAARTAQPKPRSSTEDTTPQTEQPQPKQNGSPQIKEHSSRQPEPPQSREDTTVLSKPLEMNTQFSEPPPLTMLKNASPSEQQPDMNLDREPTLYYTAESEGQTILRITTEFKTQSTIVITNSDPQPTSIMLNSEPQPTSTITDSEPQPTRIITDSEPQPTRIITDSEPQPTRIITDSEPQPTRIITDSEPQPTRIITDSEPQPTRIITDFEPQPTSIITDSEPQPTRIITDFEPQPTSIITDSEPQPTRVITDFEPQPTSIITDSEPQPTSVITDSEPQPTSVITDSELQPTSVITDSEPQPTSIITDSEPQPTSIITDSEPKPTSIITDSEPQPTSIIADSEPQPTSIITDLEPQSIKRTRVARLKPQLIQRSRVAHSNPHPSLYTSTQSKQPQPTIKSPRNTLPTESIAIFPGGPSLEQQSPSTPRVPVPEVSQKTSEKINGHNSPKDNSSSSPSSGGSLPTMSDSVEPKLTGPPTRRARLPKPKPNITCTARGATRSAAQVQESRPKHEVQTPSVETVCGEGPRQGTVVSPEVSNIIDAAQEQTSSLNEESFSQASQAFSFQTSQSSLSTVLFDLDHNQDDPDEPVFILSLTEIPVLHMGEEYGCTLQNFSQPLVLPVTDADSQLQPSDIVAPEHGLDKAVICNIEEPVSLDEVLPQTSRATINEVESVSTAGPETGQASRADADTDEDTAPPMKKRKVSETSRRVKLQVRPNTAGREKPRCSVGAKETVSALPPDQIKSTDTDGSTAHIPPTQPHPSITGNAAGGVDDSQQSIVGPLDIETGQSSGREDSRSGAETLAGLMTPLVTSSPLRRPGRKCSGFLSLVSNKAPSPAPSRGSRSSSQKPRVNTTRPGGKQAVSTPSPTRDMPAPSTTSAQIISTSIRPTAKPDDSPVGTHVQAIKPDPKTCTSPCTTAAQVSADQPSMSSSEDSYILDEEEPINVSQYFFSDIFTEVEESEG